MVLISTLSSKFNKLIATPLLRFGLSARFRLGGGIIRDNVHLDSALLLPLAQTLISIEVAQEEKQEEIEVTREKTQLDGWVDELWDKWKLDRFSPPNIESNDDSSSTSRLRSLEFYLRPALVPNECWKDVNRWRFHTRFVQWARKEFLIAQHGHLLKEALECYPKLRMTAIFQQKQKNRLSFLQQTINTDGTTQQQQKLILPTLDLLEKAFFIPKNTRKNYSKEVKPMQDIVSKHLNGDLLSIHSSLYVATNIENAASTSKLSLQEILEVAGGQVANRGPFQVLCEEANIYEFWTRDYIQNLTTYLTSRMDNKKRNTLILEVGAGDGLLSHFLQQFMMKQKKQMNGNNVKIVATDNNSWKIPSLVPVESLSVEQSLQKYVASGEYDHVICICSWMPNGVDWTKLMRQANVNEYILIGECDDGSCGDNWNTWGNPEFHPDDDKTATAPFELDGYTRHDLHSLSKLQLARFDSNVSRTSHTVSFRKTR